MLMYVACCGILRHIALACVAVKTMQHAARRRAATQRNATHLL